MPIVNMLWIGDTLGRFEHLSIASWLSAGHEVRLHSYGAIKEVPTGVELVDATRTAAFETMQRLRHRTTGSFALASDYFRYRLQQDGAGLWSDLDVVCLKPVPIDGDVVFGLEDPNTINGAVLYLKQGLPLTEGLADLFVDNFVPRWVRRSRARKLKLKRFFGVRITPADLPWGTFGPNAISELARQHGYFDSAKAPDVFYPLHYSEAHRLFDPSFSLDMVVTERTVAVHLWNEMLRDLKKTPPPAGSPLERLFARFGV
jgi:hypothetical protein